VSIRWMDCQGTEPTIGSSSQSDGLHILLLGLFTSHPILEGNMNNKQRTALVVGLVVIVVMGLFPSYTDTTDGTGGYQFLFLKWTEKEPSLEPLPVDAPQEERAAREQIMDEWREEQQKRLRRQLDVLMLFIQWVVVAAAMGVFFVAFSDPYYEASAKVISWCWREVVLASRPIGWGDTTTERTEDEAPSPQSVCYHCGQPIEQGQSPCPACGKEVDWSSE
jgi:hypothetical protein